MVALDNTFCHDCTTAVPTGRGWPCRACESADPVFSVPLVISVATQIPDGSTDYIWQGSQLMEERNSSNAPIRQYVWGTYPGAAVLTGPSAQTGFRPQNAGLGGLNVDECVQLTTFAALGSQNLAPGSYYLLQDLLYRAVALTNSSGTVVETYDTDAYGNTIIFTAPGTDGVWFTDDDVQSSYGANTTIFQGREYDPESQLYYFRTRYYVPALGRFVNRNLWGYMWARYNLYDFCRGEPGRFLEPFSDPIDGTLVLAFVLVGLGLIAAEGIKHALQNTDNISMSCPPSPNPCPDLGDKLAKAAEKAIKAAHAISDGYRNLYGGAGPRPGSGDWTKEMYKVTRDWSEYLHSLQKMKEINQQLDDAGC